MVNIYTTRATVKARIEIADTLDDADIDAALATVCREIDRYCGRQFFVELGTRLFCAYDSRCLRVDDLLAVTSLKTDLVGDRSYTTTWAATDYELDPPNALSGSPPEPFTRISVTPLGRYGFVRGDPRGNQVTGKWGYYEVLETVGSLLNEALDSSEVGVDVVDGTAYDVGQTLLIDAEQMYVSAISSNTLTVVRAVNGTTAASHLTGATIQRYTYPIVGEAAAQQAILFFKGYAGALGSVGQSGEFVQQIVTAGLHPFVQNALATFRRMEQG